MTWVKLDDQFFRHPKILALNPSARLLYVAGLCYASSQLTDGAIPRSALQLVAIEAGAKLADAKKLVDAGLWDVAADGWLIHNYSERQRSKDDVDRIREANRERKAKARERARHVDVTEMSRRDIMRSHAVSHANVTGLETETETETETEKKKGLVVLARTPETDMPPDPHQLTPLVGHWHQTWIETHAGAQPPHGWTALVGNALCGLTDPRDDLEKILATAAREGKEPKNLVHVRNDFYAERARKSAVLA